MYEAIHYFANKICWRSPRAASSSVLRVGAVGDVAKGRLFSPAATSKRGRRRDAVGGGEEGRVGAGAAPPGSRRRVPRRLRGSDVSWRPRVGVAARRRALRRPRPANRAPRMQSSLAPRKNRPRARPTAQAVGLARSRRYSSTRRAAGSSCPAPAKTAAPRRRPWRSSEPPPLAQARQPRCDRAEGRYFRAGALARDLRCVLASERPPPRALRRARSLVSRGATYIGLARSRLAVPESRPSGNCCRM